MANLHGVVQRELFGGAMSWTMPYGFLDVSDFRQVPDNQEVFTHDGTGVCIIIELLARQPVDNVDCGEFFFNDLASSNDSKRTVITSPQAPLDSRAIPKIATQASEGAHCGFACMVGGTQLVSKFTNEAGRENEIFVAMGILRFPPRVSTDILVTVTAPQKVAAGSTDVRVVQQVYDPNAAFDLLRQLLLTLSVNDWGLFVAED